MCEIAIIDPERMGIQITQQMAGLFFEEQGDGLGVVAIHHNGEGEDEPFEYSTYKSTQPHWQTLYSFLRRNYDAWRMIIHARAKTTGKVNRDTAHPIDVDCPHCDFDYVVHNGHVRANEKKRERLADKGHFFQTEVDTEVIAHQVSELPDTVEEHNRNTYSLYGNLHYILLSEDGILVRSGRKYDLSDDLLMTCRRRDFKDPEEYGFELGQNKRWALVKPGDPVDGPDIEIKESVIRTSKYSGHSYRSGGTRNRRSGVPGKRGEWAGENPDADDGSSDVDTFTVEYRDLSSYDFLSVVKVAPGVLKMYDTDRDEEGVIRRELWPRLYYFYVDEPEPENIDQLAEMAEAKRGDVPDGQELDGAVSELAAATVGEVADVDLDEETVQQAITDVA